ncbi:FMN-binding protein [Ktedonosporobacter rubrisoli]|uniref:FMN-binding protein n=1 Tax=Ktedonosporobacter rubrisoli TaxID=2509675 RepID=A0A4P6JL39_KTERU|nr:FMN-binding protein [Ktedonosporobacter rubrisoli]QBD75908.1 FMN-binding protein [Ktedonosporobacter rubrisoli]
MKKTIVSAIIIGIFVLYCFLHTQANPVAIVPAATPATRSSLSSAPTSTSTPAPDTTPGATSTSGSPYKDGTYTGSLADAQWGTVQIQAVIQNGKITNVQFLQYPNERNRSIEINRYADPQLVSEAIQAQSTKVDIVSGATDTSEAFIQSLSNALSQAQV